MNEIDSTQSIPRRQVVVTTHILNDPDVFPDAMAQVQPNGVLLILPWDRTSRSVPIKGYAPGAWQTFEHQGDHQAPAAPLASPAPPSEQATKSYVDEILAMPVSGPPVEPPMRRRAPQVDRSDSRPKATVGSGPSDADITPPRHRSWGRRR